MSTKDNSHSIGVGRIQRGDPVNRGVDYPYMGSAIAKLLDKGESGLPPTSRSSPGRRASWRRTPASWAAATERWRSATAVPDPHPGRRRAEMEQARQALRRSADARFKEGRGEADVDAWEGCYDSALKLMRRKEIFDEAAVSRSDRERYGSHPLGRHLLQARRLPRGGRALRQGDLLPLGHARGQLRDASGADAADRPALSRP
jgi:hypothetical protein